MQFAQVILKGLPSALWYSVPKELENTDVGNQVEVEVGRSKRKGWVIDVSDSCDLSTVEINKQPSSRQEKPRPLALDLFSTPDSNLPAETDARDELSLKKKLKPLQDSFRCFPPSHLLLYRWISAYYSASLSDVLDTAIPSKKESRKANQVRLIVPPENIPETLDTLQKRAPKQAEVMTYIVEQTSKCSRPLLTGQLNDIFPFARQALDVLVRKNLIELTPVSRSELEMLSQSTCPTPTSPEAPELTEAQTQAVNALTTSMCSNKSQVNPFLLLGVTGSGKTEVYIRAVEHALSLGQSALVLVPEISLTPQLVACFRQRIYQPIAILHSQVSASERWSYWEAMRSGEVRVAIGARSAVFSPLDNLGLIIVDEEHETSYKQSDGVRYNARDVAIKRGKLENAVVVLGSATPSLESLFNVKKGRYSLIELPNRISKHPLPTIEVVNSSKVKRKDMPSQSISPVLYQAISQALQDDQQVVLLYNRRGFSSWLQCTSCQKVVECPNCSVSLTFHKQSNSLLCHSCGYKSTAPQVCDFCRDPKRVDLEQLDNESYGLLTHRGGGTEKVAEELAFLFPTAKIERMDRDTVSRKQASEQILDRMRSHQSDILVGTQMIAKGHDLPNVTLVGVIDADNGLHLPDFRANERVYQLITQAAGRAGRAHLQGRVIVQTFQPDHPTIVAVATGRFKAFARYQLEQRKALIYPPWGRLIRVVVSSEDRASAKQAIEILGSFLRDYIQKNFMPNNELRVDLLGPAQAAYEKLCNRYRYHLLLRSKSIKPHLKLSQVLLEYKQFLTKQSTKSKQQVRISIDVDPHDML